MNTKLKSAVIREKYSSRGGGIEIDLTPYGYEGEKMSAYQNYLGGGMLGAVANSCTIKNWQSDKDLIDIAFELKILFCQNMGLDSKYLDVNLPISAY
jgi:hypothetical protein